MNLSGIFSKFFLAGFMLCWMAAAHAFDNVVLVANSSHFSLLHRIETAIYAQPSPRPTVIRMEAEELLDSAQFDNPFSSSQKLIVAVGSKATKAVLETKPDHAVLSILVRKHDFDHVVQAFTREHKHPPNITAVFIDQPFDRQFKLIESIVHAPENLTIGVLLGPNSEHFRHHLENVAAKTPFKLHTISVKNQDNVIGALDVLLEDVNVILAIPDQAIFNSKTARGLLLSAYRKQVPIVGFSRTYVNNGALASVYSSPKQVANQTAEMIMEIYHRSDNALPAPRFPDTYSIAINHQVGRSLSLEIDSEDAVHYSIQKQETFDPTKKCCVINYSSLSNRSDLSE